MTDTRRRRNVAKLLARLHPKGMPLQPSPGNTKGGAPDETSLDIAGALGYVSQLGAGPALAAIALCLRWWPGLIEGPMKVVGHREHRQETTRAAILQARDVVKSPDRWNSRMRNAATREVVTEARVERIPIEAPTETEAFRVIASLLERRLAEHTARLVHAVGVAVAMLELGVQREEEAARIAAEQGTHEPAARALLAARAALRDAQRDQRILTTKVDTPGFRATWARAVIHEYRNPNHCPSCTTWGWGRVGEVPHPVVEEGKTVRVEWRTCETCAGGGVTAWSVRRRAKALTINEHLWREYLNRIHDGGLALLRELEWRGALLLVRRLGG